MTGILESLKNIAYYFTMLLTLPSKLFSLMFNVPGQIVDTIWWLPVSCTVVIISILAIAIIFKIFGREG